MVFEFIITKQKILYGISVYKNNTTQDLCCQYFICELFLNFTLDHKLINPWLFHAEILLPFTIDHRGSSFDLVGKL